MDIGKIIEIGERIVEVPALKPGRAEPPAREPAPEKREKVREPA